MRNIVGMMNKVQEMQDQLKVMQGDLAAMEFTALVGNGAVSATVTGDGKLTKLKLGDVVKFKTDVEGITWAQ